MFSLPKSIVSVLKSLFSSSRKGVQVLKFCRATRGGRFFLFGMKNIGKKRKSTSFTVRNILFLFEVSRLHGRK